MVVVRIKMVLVSLKRCCKCFSLNRCLPQCVKLMIFAICSLSQTPDARFLDLAGSAFDSALGALERGVWLIGLVSQFLRVDLLKLQFTIKPHTKVLKSDKEFYSLIVQNPSHFLNFMFYYFSFVAAW